LIPRSLVGQHEEAFDERDEFVFFVLGLLSAAGRVRESVRPKLGAGAHVDSPVLGAPAPESDRLLHFVLGLAATAESLFARLPRLSVRAPSPAPKTPRSARVLR
jgi:hypothetical protein